MKTQKKIYRQGDVLLIPVASIPASAPVKAEANRLILARGEATGHHHSFTLADTVALFREDGSGGGLFLSVTGDAPAALEHQEHTALAIPPGNYRVRIQREYHPQAVRNVAD